MSSFEPNKRHLRELLIYFFYLKKSATEAHWLLVETYGEANNKCPIFDKKRRELISTPNTFTRAFKKVQA